MDKDTSTLVGVIEKAIDTVPGKDGKDGFSPSVSVSKADGVTTLTVTDKNGTTSTKIYDGTPGKDGAKGDIGAKGDPGEPGAPGAKGERGEKGDTGEPGVKGDRGERGEKGNDGFSPVVIVSKAGNATTVAVTDRNGTTTAQILNGAKGDKGDQGERGETGPTGERGPQGPRGEKGADGFSPEISLNKVSGVTTITVTDQNGTTTAQVLDGAKGEPGKDADDAEIKAAITDIAEQSALNLSALGYQRRNLLKNTAKTTVLNGVTFTVNDDGSVTADGTATALCTFTISNVSADLQGKTLLLSGCPSGGNYQSGYALYLAKISDSLTVGYDTGNGAEIAVPDEACNVRIVIRNGVTVNNLTFKPMLRYAEITDDTYEPYKPSVAEYLASLEARITALENASFGG